MPALLLPQGLLLLRGEAGQGCLLARAGRGAACWWCGCCQGLVVGWAVGFRFVYRVGVGRGVLFEGR